MNIFRFFIFQTILGVLLSLGVSSATSNKSKSLYLEGKKAVDSKDWSRYKALSKRLNKSPLQPYLDYYYYQADISRFKPEEVLNFVQNNSRRVFAPTLKHQVFSNQFNQNNYNFILKNKAALTSVSLRCMLYDAQLKTDPKTLEITRFENDWNNQLVLPKECSAVESFWLNNHATNQQLKNKIVKMLNRNYITRSQDLIARLPKEEQALYRHIIQLLNNPPALINQKNLYNNASALYTLVMNRWSNSNSTEALKGLEYLRTKKALNQQDYLKIRNQLAIYQAGRVDAIEPLKRILAIPDGEKTDQVRQWGFRLAAQKNCKLALSLLQGMSPKAQNEDTWTFWKGKMYACTGDHAKAKEEYRKVATNISYYGFLAADELNTEYTQLKKMINEPMKKEGTLSHDGYVTSLALYSVNEDGFARQEWINALQKSTPEQIHFASLYAYRHLQPHLGIISAIRAKHPGALSLRYPSNFLNSIAKYTDNKTNATQSLITKYMVLGLIRQESLFDITAQSHADAYGLMQLLIPTAQRMSTLLNEPYRESLYTPDSNIRYGIAYLHHLQNTLGDCIPYIFAGYNAGPGKVRQWQKDSSVNDILLWIENIPYYETRRYVKTLLENAVIYHYLNKEDVRIHQYLKCQN